MSDADWMPGLVRDPGVNAGYRGGQSEMVSFVIHNTAGAYGGDYSVGKQGYFNFYVPRERPPVQFAEADAITWHAGAWNGLGPGMELERLNDNWAYTDQQIEWGGRIMRWVHEKYGVPLNFYDTGGNNDLRIASPNACRGLYITHRSLNQMGGWHYDYINQDEWNRMTGGGAPPPSQEEVGDEDVMLIWKRNSSDIAVLFGNHPPQKIASINDYQKGTFLVVDPDVFDKMFQDQLALYNAAIK